MKTCKARAVGDQYHCHLCGLQWDRNDPDRPQCLNSQQRRDAIAKVAFSTARLACSANPDKQRIEEGLRWLDNVTRDD